MRRQQEMIDAEGGDYKVESWDWWYYAEKIRIENSSGLINLVVHLLYYMSLYYSSGVNFDLILYGR